VAARATLPAAANIELNPIGWSGIHGGELLVPAPESTHQVSNEM
jgi:hypothetical protein